MTKRGTEIADKVAGRGQKRHTLSIRMTDADKAKIDRYRDKHGLSMTTCLTGLALIEAEKERICSC